MKKFYASTLAIVTFLLTATALSSTAQSFLQMINNCADPLNPSVDVYIDGTISADDFYYATATGYKQLASGVAINIGIAPSNSTSVNDTVKNFEVILNNGENYIGMICGVFVPTSFAPNPQGLSTALQLILKDQVIKSPGNPLKTEFTFIAGVTDLDSSDVLARLNGIQFNDKSYGDLSSYNSLQPADYTFDITPYNNNNQLLYTYDVDFTAFAGYAITIFSSGFNEPLLNQNGPAVSLYGVDSMGSVTQFSATLRARFQAIHNCADPVLDSIDIYMFGVPVLNDFKFRTATTFLDVPAGVPLTIGVAPGNSVSEADTVKSFNLLFQNGVTYIGFAGGVVNPGLFAPNPSGIDISFSMLLDDVYHEQASNFNEVDFVVQHGITDADSVDVEIQGGSLVADNISFSGVSSYGTLNTGQYFLDVKTADGASTVATYKVDLTTHPGSAGVLFFSGFADSSLNQNGAQVALFAAWPDGVVELQPELKNANLQFIHNAADPAADSVDIYMNGNLWLNDFHFRNATSFLPVEADVDLNIGIAPANSTSANDTIKNMQLMLTAGDNYAFIANGVINAGSFLANPDGYPIDLSMWLIPSLRAAAINSGDVDFVTVHGITDAPTVDFEARNYGVLATNVGYSTISPYYSLPASDYFFDVYETGSTIIIRTYFAPLATHAGQSGVFFASGFVDPVSNQNGLPDMMFGAFADGTVVPFNNTTAVGELFNDGVSVYPNPASNQVVIESGLNSNTEIEITNALGQVVFAQKQINSPSFSMDVTKFETGIYFVKLFVEGKQFSVKKFVVE